MRTPNEDVPTILDALSAWAKTAPDATALLSPGREPTTYRELLDAVAHLAAELRARGTGKGDGIALLFPEGPDYCLALLAALSVGVAIPLTWPQPQAEYQWLLTSGWVRAVLISDGIPVSDLGPAGQGLPVITFAPGRSGRVGDFRLTGRAVADPAPGLSPPAEETALVLRSSGTTGRPKLVAITHRSIVSTCRVVIEARGLTSTDRCLSPVKAAYSQGFNALVIPIFAGATVISIPGLDLGAMPRWLHAFRPTYFSMTPAVLRLLATDRGELRDALRQSPLRCITSAAGSLSADETDHLESIMGVPILNTYGMTEATAIAGERVSEFDRVANSVGVPWCEVRVVDQNNEPVPPNESGEIVVRGPRVVAGYLDDAEATAAAFLPGGWFRTGDIGHLDRAGYLHLTGRLGEIINRGGEKIAPREVDEVLLAHPAVADAAVFAVADDRLGEDIVAAIVLREGRAVSPRELRTWLRARLAQYKTPRRIWFVEALPRTPTGKVQRGELARCWDREHG